MRASSHALRRLRGNDANTIAEQRIYTEPTAKSEFENTFASKSPECAECSMIRLAVESIEKVRHGAGEQASRPGELNAKPVRSCHGGRISPS